MKQEIYNSSTHGEISLSFTGRRLMANLRDAVSEYANKYTEERASGFNGISNLWEPVSKARGELAMYISQLERDSIRANESYNGEELGKAEPKAEPKIVDFEPVEITSLGDKVSIKIRLPLPSNHSIRIDADNSVDISHYESSPIMSESAQAKLNTIETFFKIFNKGEMTKDILLHRIIDVIK